MSSPPPTPTILSLKTLPIVERWDCGSCGQCCRGTVFVLEDEEVRRIRQQGWESRAEFRGVRVLRRHGLLRPRYTLGKRRDGSCVFLTASNRCRIHEEFGEEAKPRICRTFPVQAVALGSFAQVMVRRYCPSAAGGVGRVVDLQRDDIRRMADLRPPRVAVPPPIARRQVRPWKDAIRVLESLERLLGDRQYPLLQRLQHGLVFCGHLEACRLRKLDGPRLGELLQMLETAAVQQRDPLLDPAAEPLAPSRSARMLFRRVAVEYLRVHPRLRLAGTWGDRWRMLRAMMALGRGKGQIPSVGTTLGPVEALLLDRPLGPLPEPVLRPLADYFEAAACSYHYAILGREGWSIVESFRNLALSYAVALWLVRYTRPDAPPQREDMIDAVGALDRGQGSAPLLGRAHRWRLGTLTRLGALPYLLAWHGR